MRRAIAGIATLFVLLAISVFVPAVPSSAKASNSTSTSGGQPCTANLTNCIFAGESVQGYGSVSYYLTGRGAFYYQGNYELMSNTNLTVSLTG
ncbi:MAG: hypothetical protein KGI38_04595 [Thaumarchaeota archaeon]|nr:hypothetical protein [Nitrososphaerota archaeon]